MTAVKTAMVIFFAPGNVYEKNGVIYTCVTVDWADGGKAFLVADNGQHVVAIGVFRWTNVTSMLEDFQIGQHIKFMRVEGLVDEGSVIARRITVDDHVRLCISTSSGRWFTVGLDGRGRLHELKV